MQIIGLHKNVYKLYAWARTQECLDAYRIKYEDRVQQWDDLRAEGVSLENALNSSASPARHITFIRVF